MGNRITAQQIYDKKTEIKPGWVNIQVPKKIAESLQKLDLEHEEFMGYFRLILQTDVWESLRAFTDNPVHDKRTFDKVLFEYLHGISTVDDHIIYSDQIDFLYLMNEMLSTMVEAKDQLRKEEES